jgi:hypothetical protein
MHDNMSKLDYFYFLYTLYIIHAYVYIVKVK